MSEAHGPQDQSHDAPHEGPIKTPQQLIWAVAASFVIPIFVIVLLVTNVSSFFRPSAGSDTLDEQSTAERIARVGSITVKDLTDAASLATGQKVYEVQCVACHSSGAAGAPKLADAAAWGPRLGQGLEGLVNSALKGKGAMGAQGGGDYSDFEITRAVVYMANQGGGKFAEPTVPAPAASAP
jgi:cytochrome c5